VSGRSSGRRMGGSFNAGDIRLFSDPLARVNVARSVDFADKYPACHAGGRGFTSRRRRNRRPVTLSSSLWRLTPSHRRTTRPAGTRTRGDACWQPFSQLVSRPKCRAGVVLEPNWARYGGDPHAQVNLPPALDFATTRCRDCRLEEHPKDVWLQVWPAPQRSLGTIRVC
jgi:hypothetical protein